MFTVKRGSGGIAGKTGAKALSKEEHNPSNDYSQNNISIPSVSFFPVGMPVADYFFAHPKK